MPSPRSRAANPSSTGCSSAQLSSNISSLNLQQLRRTRAITVYRISRTGFPLSFFVLNVIYWCVFLNSEDPSAQQQQP